MTHRPGPVIYIGLQNARVGVTQDFVENIDQAGEKWLLDLTTATTTGADISSNTGAGLFFCWRHRAGYRGRERDHGCRLWDSVCAVLRQTADPVRVCE
jgi:hypothetical protein